MSRANVARSPQELANRDLARQVRGPLILITIGVLFLLDRFTQFGFGETWPVILIVVGLLTLLGGLRRRSRGPDYAPDIPPGVPPGMGVPPSSVPPNIPPSGDWR